MKKHTLLLLCLAGLSILLSSWGSVGHFKINHDASLSFDPQMTIFNAWTNTLANHASDADDRKATDPDEAVRHYIDIDVYPEFIQNGYIASTLDSLVFIHGSAYVYDHGILPYSTRIAYDSLRHCLHRGDWDKASLFAADLGHYVGDGHMPLHITENYNGQSTNNSGIHSRYESTMIGNYISEIVYTGDSVHFISNVNKYIFDYLYFDYGYVDSVLLADTYAKTISSNTNSTQYKQALWNRTKGFTVMLFKNASHALAELIYTAWINAGSPNYGSASAWSQYLPHLAMLSQPTPNPFAEKTLIRYSLPASSRIRLAINDVNGSRIATLFEGYRVKGDYETEWAPASLRAGVYYLTLTSESGTQVRKLMCTK